MVVNAARIELQLRLEVHVMKKIGLGAARAAELCIPLFLGACAASPATQQPVEAPPASAPVASAPAQPPPAESAGVDSKTAPTGVESGAAANVVTGSAATGAVAAAEAEEQHEPYFDKFALHENSLTGGVHIDADCKKVWEVMTTIDLLQKWAPHLHLTSINNQKTATQRGDAVNFRVERMSGTGTGQFILASPVPFHRVQAVVVPQKGPWIRIQEWNMVPEGDKKCRVDYNESYNELWVKHQGLEGTNYIKKIRDHHIHVVLRRMKNLAEGKDAGPADEVTYLMEDAKTFPDKLRNTGTK
jgi:hypothetical protein